MPHLGFWHESFVTAPYFLLALGIYSLIISIYGFWFCYGENRGFLMLFAIFLIIAIVGQMASIIIFGRVDSEIDKGCCTGRETANYLTKKYSDNGHYKHSMDTIQHHLKCCGVHSYRDWNIASTQVPDSCCKLNSPQCAYDLYDGNNHMELLEERIYVSGCLNEIRTLMEIQLAPLISVYSGIGVLIAVIQLITILLIILLIFLIFRKRQKAHKEVEPHPVITIIFSQVELA